MPWQEDSGIGGFRRTSSAAREGAEATLASIAGVTIHSRRSRLGTPLSATKRRRPPAARLRRSTGFAYPSPSKPTPTDS